jgi:hypothetical protein
MLSSLTTEGNRRIDRLNKKGTTKTSSIYPTKGIKSGIISRGLNKYNNDSSVGNFAVREVLLSFRA